MPIHLPPINRRRFLAGSLAASAAALLPRCLRADAASADPNHWVLFSDTHIWEHRDQEHKGVRPAVNLALVRRQIGELPARPAGAIHCGDCVYIQGNAADYAVLAEELKPFREMGLPLHLALGNHDNREHFYAAFPELRPAVPPVPDKKVAVVEAPNANWFLLDALRQTNSTPGELGEKQLKWLAKELDARPNKPALIVAHHNLEFDKPTTGLTDTKALWEVIGPRKQVKAYVFGHTHVWQVAEHDGIQLINVPATAWVFDAKQPQGWVDVHLLPGGIQLQLHCLDAKHPKQGEQFELKYRT
jgi:3',5'-cyclic-AMP phosphodiesterase